MSSIDGRHPEPEGPVKPDEHVASELRDFLEADRSRLGDIYRGLARGLSAEEISAEIGVDVGNSFWSYNRLLRSLLEGDIPTAPTVALGVSRRFRSILRSPSLSNACRSYLSHNLAALERRAEDVTAKVAEVEHAKEQTDAAEALNEMGIYVYALPHYLRYPYDSASGRTLMKVGRSDSDVIQRFRNQTRTTALPEEPILLRIYRTDPDRSGPVETSFHRLLEAADHYRNVARTAGREWFITSTTFLDEVARVMALPIRVVNDALVADED